eukprot:NODE_3_length_80033_cov_0.932970.p25 type:complete len:331 gc:universal NODE_3_length_80033_cov_0.932970:27792-28784(+)
MKQIYCGILGATGAVGQMFLKLLENHPRFVIKCLGASQKSAGKKIGEFVDLQQDLGNFEILLCEPELFQNCSIIFSALDSSVAGEIEMKFAKYGYPVFSNSKNWRMDPLVPLCVPYCNPEHLKLVERQKKEWKCNGFIVTNANCSTTGLVVVLKSLEAIIKFTNVRIHTLQAVSGAGYPGLSVIDIHDNVIPYIEGEEEKLETEALKILGSFIEAKGHIQSKDLKIIAVCNRVCVLNGHTLNIEIKPDVDVIPLEKIKKHFENLDHIRILESSNRPQPRLDRKYGMKVSVGRIRVKNDELCLTAVFHNTILGAAGSSIWNAEEALKLNLI